MKQNIKVGIKGKYIFRDSQGNITRVVDNLVTDWGFKRFVGYGNHWCYNFWMNMRYVFFGEQTATELPTDYELANYHIPNNWLTQGAHYNPIKPIVGTPTFFLKHLSVNPQPAGAVSPWHPDAWNALDWNNAQWTTNTGKYWWPPRMNWELPAGSYTPNDTFNYSPYPNLVGVTYRTDPLTGDIVLRFANTWNLTFNTAVTIGEMGVGPVPLNTDDNPIILCGGTEPWAEGEVSAPYYPSSSPVESSRIGHKNTITQSLFSRATMNPQAFFNAGDSTTVTYLCDVVLCQEMAMSIGMNFVLGPGSAPGDALPPNKTSMRQAPLFKLPGNNKITNFGTKWMVTGAVAVKTDEDNIPAVAIPLLDNMHTSYKGVWVLDTFKYTIPVYNALVPTLTADDQTYNVAGFGAKAIANPIVTNFEKNVDSSLPNNPVSYIKRYPPFGPVQTLPVAGSGPAGSENTYVTTINFVLPTNHWIVGGTGGGEEMNSFCLWRPINRNHFVEMPSRVQTGYHTFLDTFYTPSPNKFIKLTYQIIWNR